MMEAMALKVFFNWLKDKGYLKVVEMSNGDMMLQIDMPGEIVGKNLLKKNGKWIENFKDMYGEKK